MSNTDLTHIAMLLDRSGSMASIRTATQEGFDAFVLEQRGTPGRATITLAQFDDRYEEVYAGIDIQEAPTLVLEPRGSTALLDSIGRLISSTAASIGQLPESERPGTVIIGIMTDGHENASRELTHAAVKALITEREATFGWTFLYLGANQDAIEVGASIGVARERSLTYSPGAAPDAYRAASASMSRSRLARASGADSADARQAASFSEEERSDASTATATAAGGRPARRATPGAAPTAPGAEAPAPRPAVHRERRT